VLDYRLKDKLIVALDVDSVEAAETFLNALAGEVKYFKVGGQLFTASGPKAVEMVAEKGAKVFLDLKFYDIPRTVYSSTATASAMLTSGLSQSDISNGIKGIIEPPVFMMTVHVEGGREMLQAALNGASEKSKILGIKRPLIVGVTRLTSNAGEQNLVKIVLEMAKLSKDAGLDGVVCSVHEAAAIRKEFGREFVIVTPGIRPKNAKPDDQKRVATAEEALSAGSDFLVVGRPILQAPDPLQALVDLL